MIKKRLTPSQILTLGFLTFILIGTLLLMLPFSTTNGISFIDALFTSTSAICVTGLIVMDTPKDFTLWGQVIILFLIQIGGLGYMTSATIISLAIGKRIGLGERLIMKEALNVLSLEGIVKFTKKVLFITIFFEMLGTVILGIRFAADLGIARGLYYGLFHAVSAFNNAGFSLFSDNLINYRGDITVNLVICVLIFFGGIGFLVINDIYNFCRNNIVRLSVHTKITLATSGVLIVVYAIMMLIFENSNPATMKNMSLIEKILASVFSSITARTAGFNTIDYSLLRIETLFLTIIIMFIGASPGSAGGGIKTTTFALIIASIYATMRGMRDTVLFRRRIPLETISRSYLLATLAAILIIVISMLIIYYEDTKYLSTIFEVISAFGTVGLSVGDGGTRSFSALLTPAGKFFISFAMFAGRLGPLTLAVAVMAKTEVRFRYPEGRVLIG